MILRARPRTNQTGPELLELLGSSTKALAARGYTGPYPGPGLGFDRRLQSLSHRRIGEPLAPRSRARRRGAYPPGAATTITRGTQGAPSSGRRQPRESCVVETDLSTRTAKIDSRA